MGFRLVHLSSRVRRGIRESYAPAILQKQNPNQFAKCHTYPPHSVGKLSLEVGLCFFWVLLFFCFVFVFVFCLFFFFCFVFCCCFIFASLFL